MSRTVSTPRDEAPSGDPEAGRGAGSLSPVDSPWSRSPQEVVEALDASPEAGLTAAEAARRREEWGPNELRRHSRRGFTEILVDQFRSVVVLLLAAAAVVSLIVGAHLEAVAIGVVLVINAAIGLVTELRAVRSMESLRGLGTVETTVVRDGGALRWPGKPPTSSSRTTGSPPS